MKLRKSLSCLGLTLLLTSCGANKPKIHHLTQAEIKTYRNAQNYTVKLPESWKAVPDHAVETDCSRDRLQSVSTNENTNIIISS